MTSVPSGTNHTNGERPRDRFRPAGRRPIHHQKPSAEANANIKTSTLTFLHRRPARDLDLFVVGERDLDVGHLQRRRRRNPPTERGRHKGHTDVQQSHEEKQHREVHGELMRGDESMSTY